MTDRLFTTMPYADKELEIHYISDDEAKVRHITAEAFERWGWVRDPKDTGWMNPDNSKPLTKHKPCRKSLDIHRQDPRSPR